MNGAIRNAIWGAPKLSQQEEIQAKDLSFALSRNELEGKVRKLHTSIKNTSLTSFLSFGFLVVFHVILALDAPLTPVEQERANIISFVTFCIFLLSTFLTHKLARREFVANRAIERHDLSVRLTGRSPEELHS